MPGRVRGGVVSRTGDRVGEALELRTRRVGVEGFVASLRGGERSIFFFWQLSLLRWAVRVPSVLPSVQAARLLVFFCLGLPSSHCFWASRCAFCGALMAHEYACTTSRPLFLIGLGQPIRV